MMIDNLNGNKGISLMKVKYDEEPVAAESPRIDRNQF